MKKPGPARTVFLAGFMGSGKTSVGRALARRLGWRFVDLDRNIQQREGTSIAKIFAQNGEAGFRRAESAALRDLLAGLGQQPPTVVALGGGTLSIAQNRLRLRQPGGPVVFLDAPLSTLRERCRRSGRQRPLFASLKRFRQLYQSRLPQYRNATVRITTWRKHPSAVAAEVAAALGLKSQQEVR